jgi:GH25 family lysozyme M1 (1,4-beta-N-acetylmuramidase)
VDANKRAHKYHKVDIRYFNDPMDYNRVHEDVIRYDTEPLYTVEIAKSELERIAEFEQQVFNNAKQTGHYNLFQTIVEQKERERFLKEKYPAVKKAYEQYSLMLKLAESGEL